jgi:hypothetical protein
VLVLVLIDTLAIVMLLLLLVVIWNKLLFLFF